VQQINERRAFLLSYRQQLATQGVTNKTMMDQEQEANRVIVEALNQQQQIDGQIAAADQALTTLNNLSMAHVRSKPELELKVQSIEGLQSGMQERMTKIERAVMRQEFAAEDALKAAAAAVARNPLDPLGGLTLEHEQIKECRALKFLSSMYIRYCHFGSKPMKTLTRKQAVNNSWGDMYVKPVKAVKAVKKPNSRRGVGLKKLVTQSFITRRNITRKKREKQKKEAVAAAKKMNLENDE
jgi:hypothetical protein